MASDGRREHDLPVGDRVAGAFREWVPDALLEHLAALASVARLGRFASVGAVGALCDNLVLAAVVETGLLVRLAGGVLAEGSSFAVVAGAVLAKETSIAVMFGLNEVWTFSDAAGEDGGLIRRFLVSNAVRAGGALVGIGVLYALTTVFGVWYLLANVAGIGVGFVLNYVAESLVTWRIHRRE